MPELPDVTLYCEHLRRRTAGIRLDQVRIASPFVLRTVDPPYREAVGRTVRGVTRLGKRIAFDLDGLYVVLHLMIAGRLHWKRVGAKVPRKAGLAAFDFPSGTLLFTEAASKKRASIHVTRSLDELERGGIEVLDSSLHEFRAALRRDDRTLKRALTDPTVLSGIGNAYSDEILHAAQISPMQRTRNLGDDEMACLYATTRRILEEWTARLREEAGDDFPEHVTAFRAGMAVHGRAGQPCPVCGAPVQRIVYAENEANYCAHCQTGGRLLADRALSRLLKSDWPRTLEELETRKRG